MTVTPALELLIQGNKYSGRSRHWEGRKRGGFWIAMTAGTQSRGTSWIRGVNGEALGVQQMW